MVLKLLLIVISTLLLTWLLISICQRHIPILSKKFVVIAFWIKILAGVGMAILYSSYYPNRDEADIFKYFDDSKVLYDAIIENPVNGFSAFMGNDDDPFIKKSIMDKMNHWYRPYYGDQSNDSHLMIRFNTILRFVSFGNYEVHVAFMSFISFLGLIMLFKGLMPTIPYHNISLFKLIFFIPSILIWSSSVLKEGFVIFGLGLLVLSVSGLRKNIFLSCIWLILAAILLVSVKMYVLIAFIPGYLAFIWVWNNSLKATLKYITVLLFVMGIGLNLRLLGNSFDILGMISVKQSEFICLAEWVGSGSAVYIPPLDGTLLSMLKALPVAMMNVICRPWPWESSSAVVLLAMLENWLFISLLVYILIKPLRIDRPKLNQLLIWLSFIALLYALIGLTTPVMGAIVRYKVPAWPFLIYIACLLTPSNKLRWATKIIEKV